MTKFNREDFIWSKMKEHWDYLQEAGYEVAALFLQGSQNYSTDIYTEDYMSDVDTKAIIMPTLDKIIEGSMPISDTHVMPDNSHIDIKDIRVMVEQWNKQNISYLELLYTDYFMINQEYADYMQRYTDIRDDITSMHKNQLLRCIQGMSGNKIKALEHPYPGLIDKITKYGYDEKQLLHIIRLNDFTTQWLSNEVDNHTTFKKIYRPYLETLEMISKIRAYWFNLESAREMAKMYDDDTNAKIKDYISKHIPDEVNSNVAKEMNQIKCEMIRFALEKELLEDVN
jgi:hypothetical protein